MYTSKGENRERHVKRNNKRKVYREEGRKSNKK
jgi:hypothetical protein